MKKKIDIVKSIKRASRIAYSEIPTKMKVIPNKKKKILDKLSKEEM